SRGKDRPEYEKDRGADIHRWSPQGKRMIGTVSGYIQPYSSLQGLGRCGQLPLPATGQRSDPLWTWAVRLVNGTDRHHLAVPDSGRCSRHAPSPTAASPAFPRRGTPESPSHSTSNLGSGNQTPSSAWPT